MKSFKIFLAAAIAAISLSASAQAPAFSPKDTRLPHFKYGPWVEAVTENSFTVLWMTEEDCMCRVEAREADGRSWYRGRRPSWYETVSGRRLTGRLHSIKVDGLKPGTTYEYKVYAAAVEDDSHGNRNNFSPEQCIREVFTVRTLDPKAEVCRFSVVNDIHYNMDRFTALMNTVNRDSTDFLVLNGDIVSQADALDTVVKYTFSPMKGLCSNFPVFYARGNHEGRGPAWYTLPRAFPSSTGEFYYTFRQGPVAFVVLDAGEDKPDDDVEYSGTAMYDQYRAAELEWLKGALKDPSFTSAPWKVCIIHIPTFGTKSAWYTQNWITENFAPLLNDAGVKLMISGHHHSYRCYEPGEFNNKYTIFVNDCKERLDFSADKDRISLRTFDVDGNLVRAKTITR